MDGVDQSFWYSVSSQNIKDGRHVGLDFYDLLIEALKFRLLSVRVASGPSVSNRKMSEMGMFEQLRSNPTCLNYRSAAVWFTPIHPWRKRRL